MTQSVNINTNGNTDVVYIKEIGDIRVTLTFKNFIDYITYLEYEKGNINLPKFKGEDAV